MNERGLGRDFRQTGEADDGWIGVRLAHDGPLQKGG
jgi:hypothetical protein